MERIPCIPLHEQEQWEEWNDALGLPSGTVYDSKSYKQLEKKPLPIQKNNGQIKTVHAQWNWLQQAD